MNPQQFNFLGNNTLQNFQNNTGGMINQTSNESEKFPWLTKQQETEIMNKANQANVTESQKNYMLNDMYQQQLRRNQITKFAEERENTKRQLIRRAVESKDIKTSKQSKQIEKKWDVADMIRKYVSATQEIDLNKLNKVSDDQIIADFTADNPDVAYAIDDFTKSQMSSQYFSEMMGFSQFEEQQDEWFFKNLLNSITYGVETWAKWLKWLIDKWLDTVEWNSNESSYSMENLTAFDNYIQHKYWVSGSQLRESDKDVWQQERNLVQDNPEVLKQYMTTASEDALNFAEWYTDALFTATNPYMALGMKTVWAGEQEMWGGVLTWLAEKMGWVWEIINSIPWLSNYRDTLSPEDQQRFDAFVGNVAVGLILWTKNKKNIIKDPKTFLMENLQPNQITKNFVQSVTWMPDRLLWGTDSLAGGAKWLMSKAAKWVDNAGNVLDRAAEWGAKKITWTATAQDKLYKAQEPRMNILSEKKNLERKRANSDRANELILDNGYKPTNTAERLEAHQKTLNKLWGQVMEKVNAQEWVNVDQSSMITALSDYIKSKKKLWVAWISSDIKALEAELKSIKKMQAEWNTDIPTLEAKKQVLNDLIDRKGQEASEVYKWGIKLLTQEIWKIEDSIISQIPWEFSDLKRDVWALLDTYEDVFKADMKNQRKKWLWLTETYSRIEWIGDTLWGIVKLFWGDASGLVKWLWKLALGKSLAKASDVDFLIKQWFEDLANEKGLAENQVSSKTAKYQVADNLEAEYEKAVKEWNTDRAKEILKEYAEKNWYIERNDDYKVSHRAPSSSVDKADFRNLDKLNEALDWAWDMNLYAVANWISQQPMDMLSRENAWRNYRTSFSRESFNAIRDAMDSIQEQMNKYWEVKDMPKVKVYRAVRDNKKIVSKLQKDLDLYQAWTDREKENNKKSFKIWDLSKDSKEAYDFYVEQYNKWWDDMTPQESLATYLKNRIDEYNRYSVKEWMFESWWDRVTPSKEYATMHGKNTLEWNYKIISEEVPADQLWWDWNVIEEWWFDDWNNTAIKKWAKNSRKQLEITYDDNWKLIPLNKRFNEKKSDTRYQKYWVAWQWEKGISATEWLNIRNFKNWKTVQELANQYWIDTKIVDSISTPEWQRAYWMYWDRLITLSKDLKESTVPHELLHGVFDMVDSKRRTSILEWIQKKLNIDNVQAEEWLADNFSEYYRTGKFWTKWLAKWLVEKVKQFFYQVKSYIDGTYKNGKQIRQLFDDIIDWKIEWEYWVYSDPKFQTVWHGSKADFEKFDSSHMGEWAWSQAHGWGHYVTKNQDSAKIYAQWDSQTTYKWKTYNDLFREWVNTNNLEYLAAADVMSTLKRYDTIEEAFEHTHSIDDAKEAMYKQLKKENFKREWGYVYEAEIPDPVKKNTPTGKNYWEEQKVLPWSQVDKIMSKAKKAFTQEQYKEFEQMVDEWNFNWGKMISEDIYKALDRALWWEKEASKFLESLGYDWIHYNWWRDGEVYVIFNDDAIKIKNKEKVLQSI